MCFHVILKGFCFQNIFEMVNRFLISKTTQSIVLGVQGISHHEGIWTYECGGELKGPSKSFFIIQSTENPNLISEWIL